LERARDGTTATRPGTGGGLCPATAGTAAPIVGIAAGNAKILPPWYNGNSRVDADDWAQDFGDYINLCQIPLRDAKILLRNRLPGVAWTCIEGMPADLGVVSLPSIVQLAMTHSSLPRQRHGVAIRSTVHVALHSLTSLRHHQLTYLLVSLCRG